MHGCTYFRLPIHIFLTWRNNDSHTGNGILLFKMTLIGALITGLLSGNTVPEKPTATVIQKQAQQVLKVQEYLNKKKQIVQRKHLIQTAQRIDGVMGTYAVKESERYHVNPKLVLAVMHVESRGAMHVVSYGGAVGPMQLMPSTAYNVLHVNPWNPYANVQGGVLLLKQLIHQFNGHVNLALAAYNSGPQNVINSGYTVPSFCQEYVQKVRFVEDSI